MMSITHTENNVIVMCHKQFIDTIYKRIEGEKNTFKTNYKFFAIHSPFKTKKRKNYDEQCEVVKYVKKSLIAVNNILKTAKLNAKDAQFRAKEFADTFYLQSAKRSLNNFHGGNTTSSNLITIYKGEKYLIPKQCFFYNYDVSRLEEFLNPLVYDLILLDPPWWNKFIRRKKSASADCCYKMLWNADLAKLPIDKILAADGLVVVWCTNSESHFLALKNDIFPAWGVEYVATWYWIKVTTVGEPVTPFSPFNGKQPFEKLIFAARNPGSRVIPLPEDMKVLASVPSSIHSHKPPLCEVLKPYVPLSPKCLEVFARYLLPNWTSFGNEVLKLQHISFFIEEPPEGEESIDATVALE